MYLVQVLVFVKGKRVGVSRRKLGCIVVLVSDRDGVDDRGVQPGAICGSHMERVSSHLLPVNVGCRKQRSRTNVVCISETY